MTGLPVLLWTFLGSVLASMLLARGIARLATACGWLDQPSPRRVHTRPTPRLGGVAMFGAFVIVLLALVFGGRLHAYTAVGLLLGAGALTLVGFVDDLWGLPPGIRLAFDVAAAAVIVGVYDVSIRSVTVPFFETYHLQGSLLGYAFTVFWIVGMINTVNFADGIDGLAGGLAFVFALVLFVAGLRLAQEELPLYACALGGAALGFLRYNWTPARIFMGDSGARFLGYTMGVLSVLGNAKLATGLLVMGLPIVDTAYTILRRWRTGTQVQIFDKEHLHHRFLSMGLSQRATALVFYALALAFGGAALLPSREGRFAALVLLGVSSAGIIWYVNRRLQATRR